MADLARRRAAHFANFQDDSLEEQGNVHVGTNNARTLGPWSSAVELVAAREAAAAQRAAGEEAAWAPSRDPSLGPHPRSAVGPLFDACLRVLTTYVDCIESLVGVPDAIRVRLAASVAAKRKLSPQVARLFGGGSPSELVLPDCTQLDAPAMGELLELCITPRLERLELGMCGRGFGDEAAKAVTAGGQLSRLESVMLAGAYRLSDDGLATVLAAAPELRRLVVPDCNKLSGALLMRLPAWAPKLRTLHLTNCRGISAESLVATLPQLQALHSLHLDGIPEVDDAVVSVAARVAALRELSIRSTQVSDAGLSALAASRPELTSLTIDECHKASDVGIQALAGGCRALKVLSLRRCARVSDEALAALLAGRAYTRVVLSGVSGTGAGALRALAGGSHDTLEYLDISFCRNAPDSAVGKLLDACTALKEVLLFGCSQLTARALYGHGNAALCMEGLGTHIAATAAVEVA